MKRIFLFTLPILFLSGQLINAQEKTSGTVIYDEVRKIEIKLEGEMAHLMKDMPKEQKSEKVLYFSPSASLYKNMEKDENEDYSMEGSGMRIMVNAPDNVLFIDLDKEEVIEKREFMTRTFLINGDISSRDWKISGEQKIILEHPCMEASITDTAGVVTRVWFAPTIPVKSGPATFYNLPGLVLEVDIDNGRQKFLAKSIDFEAPEKDLFKKPKDGKKVTKQEFDNIVAEKMKEMGAEGAVQGGTQVMIRIKH
ncbi:MAG: GLPGLI family protein [Marinilabiliaceae bacterium]|jgi:GLPGLI family protein|nr:GLPGLI family protein [Marinilabiliaceae bacterium]